MRIALKSLLPVSMGLILALLPKYIFLKYSKSKKEEFKSLPYIAGSLPVAYSIFYIIYSGLSAKSNLSLEVFLNFLQHSIGGGVAVGLISFYLYQNFKQQIPWLKGWRIKLIFLLGIVSIFGVANELVEFSLDLINLGTFSRDRFDTWVDLFANTLGALTGLYLPLLYLSLRCKKPSPKKP